MNLTDLLNTDVSDLGRMARGGVDWWLRELSAMAPPGLRRLLETRPALMAEPRPGGGYRLTRQGQVAREAPGATGQPLPVTLVLPHDQALVREVATPDLPDRDVRRMLALDIDRLTPFQADEVYVDIVPGARDAAGGRRPAAVAAIPRASAEAALAAARAAGLDPQAVILADPITGEPAFDFAPALRQAGALARTRPYRAYAWGAVAVLLVLNLAAAVGRDMLDIARLNAALDAQRPAVEQAQHWRAQAQAEAARRRDLLRRRDRGEPLRVLEAASRAVPAAAWVQRLAWDGQAVRLAGYRQDAVDVVAALARDPLFAQARNSLTDAPPRMAAGVPFDVTADVKPDGPEARPVRR